MNTRNAYIAGTNDSRSSVVDGTNKLRGGLTVDPSHLWDEDNTPWDPDSNQPWEDELTMPNKFEDNGVNKTRNLKP